MKELTPEQTAALKRHGMTYTYDRAERLIRDLSNSMDEVFGTMFTLSKQVDAGQLRFKEAPVIPFNGLLKADKRIYYHEPSSVETYNIKSGAAYRTPESARANINAAWEASQAALAEYKEVANHNLETWETLKKMLVLMGLPESQYVYKSKRSSKGTWQTAEWVDALRTALGKKFVLSPSTMVEGDYKMYLKAVDEWEAQLKKEEAAAEEVKNAKKRELAEDQRRIRLNQEYDLNLEFPTDREIEIDDLVREKVFAYDKYIRLAYYLYKNRCDWNDGPSYAETGLNGFTIETPVDQKIHDEIFGLVENWDFDGRVFRDCEWNYDRLVGYAQQRYVDLSVEPVIPITTMWNDITHGE